MKTIGIVVLNYINYSETINCVDSLLTQEDIATGIVIVDNGSGNESVKKLSERYGEEPIVDIIELSQNVGFAQGMNAGIAFLRNKGISNIFICNSDLFFATPKILAQMANSEQFKDKKVAVIDPVVLNVDGSKATRIYFKNKLLRLRMIKTFFPVIDRIKTSVIKKKSPEKASYDENAIVKQRYSNNTTTHDNEYLVVGCGYLLTERFFDYYNGLYPETFLYHEEYALILFLKACGLKTSFVETDIIRHKHGASTFKGKKKRTNKSSKNSVLKLILLSDKAILRKYGKK